MNTIELKQRADGSTLLVLKVDHRLLGKATFFPSKRRAVFWSYEGGRFNRTFAMREVDRDHVVHNLLVAAFGAEALPPFKLIEKPNGQ